MPGKNILLIEPGYKNKYPPLGLMKIAQYHGPRGKGDNVRFIKRHERGHEKWVEEIAWDRVYITTLFSFEFAKTAEAIDYAKRVVNGQTDRIFVGGIAASLMHDRFVEREEWRGIRFIKGLLGQAPAVSLRLEEDEFYGDDVVGTPIEDLTPDYDILQQVPYKYAVHDAYFGYASRGCIRKCSFCGVPKLEGAQREVQPITAMVNNIAELYGEKKDLVLMDNNVVASARFKEIVAEIRDLGFKRGATLNSRKIPVQRRVDFNQGVDARILCKDPMYLRELSSICIKPLRIAFDHLGLRKPYEEAIKIAHGFGLHELSNYMLYNFHDTPEDLYERMALNVQLNVDLGIRIWSFPMRYQPTNLPERSHIGEHWKRYQLRSLQLILQATHGVVSGAPEFFRRAFGKTAQEFKALLLRPQKLIFNRDHFECFEGKPEFEEFQKAFDTLSDAQQRELLELLSQADPREFRKLPGLTTDKSLKRILRFYVPMDKDEEAEIWAKRKKRRVAAPPEDERVEDAGLQDDSASSAGPQPEINFGVSA